MSSHREAPEISKDPVADSTDVYAFVSPDRPDTVTLIANYIPLQTPDGGPNFYEFGDDVLYEINISNSGKAEADITYQFEFNTQIRNKNTFLYNTGPITTHRRRDLEPAAVLLGHQGRERTLEGARQGPAMPAGERRTAQHAELRRAGRPGGAHDRRRPEGLRRPARRRLPRRPRQRLRPRGAPAGQPPAPDLDARHHGRSTRLQGFNVHTSRLQVPKRDLTKDGKCRPAVGAGKSVIGVWATASRRKSQIWDSRAGKYVGHGPWKQVSRLGNPLFNEVIVPMAEKDLWNARPPSRDAPVRQVRRPARSWPSSCRSSTRACSRTWRPTARRGRT